MLKFLYYYVRSMRLYYGFVTATTVLVGLCLAHGTYNELKLSWAVSCLPWTLRDVALLAMGFFAWGFNQIFSDWYDRKEDAINAPHRPMVTGALAPRPAFALSAVGLATIAIAGFLMSPWTLAFLVLGGVLNIAYSLLKRMPILNCLVYACAISCCALFAIAGVTGRCPNVHELEFVEEWIVPFHFLMCHNSYYKDVAGDSATGVRTLQTMRPKVAMFVSVFCPCLAVLRLNIVSWFNMQLFLLSLSIVAIVFAFQYFISRGRFHRATCLNCQLCVLLLLMQFIAATWIYAIASLVAIQLLFLWYNDEKE